MKLYLSQHEAIQLQEQIRAANALAYACRSLAPGATNADLNAFCEDAAHQAEQTAFRLMSLLEDIIH